jgi:ornithine--oxo-acid transaminase
VLAKETHGRTIRIAPPLVISDDEIEWAIDQLETVLASCPRVAASEHRNTRTT